MSSESARIQAELEIATMRLMTARTPVQRHRAWADVQRLHRERAADRERVAHLERERGLTR